MSRFAATTRTSGAPNSRWTSCTSTHRWPRRTTHQATRGSRARQRATTTSGICRPASWRRLRASTPHRDTTLGSRTPSLRLPQVSPRLRWRSGDGSSAYGCGRGHSEARRRRSSCSSPSGRSPRSSNGRRPTSTTTSASTARWASSGSSRALLTRRMTRMRSAFAAQPSLRAPTPGTRPSFGSGGVGRASSPTPSRSSRSLVSCSATCTPT